MVDETTVADLMDNKIDDHFQEEIFDAMSKIPGIDEYLKKTMAKDVQRFFSASPEQQPIIRGGFLRAQYLLKCIVDRREGSKKAKEKLDNK